LARERPLLAWICSPANRPSLMKALVWVVFVILVAFWTGLVALTEQLSQWLLASMATGQVGELAAIPGQWPVPAWLGLWVDTEWLKGMQEAGLGLVQWLTQVMPSADGLMRRCLWARYCPA